MLGGILIRVQRAKSVQGAVGGRLDLLLPWSAWENIVLALQKKDMLVQPILA